MAKAKMLLNGCIPTVLIIVALMTPAIARAGSVTIWPDQLIPALPVSSQEQSISSASNGTFYLPILIPVNARITRMYYYHTGVGGPALTRFVVRRVKLGNEAELIGSESSTDATGTIIRVEVPITGNPLIRSGYRYYVRLQSDNGNSLFLGAKILYLE